MSWVVLQRIERHTVVTVNSDGRTCNAEAVHNINELKQEQVQKTVRAVYTHMTW